MAKVKFKPDATKSAQEQLHEVLAQNALEVRDCLKYWDEDGNGLVSKKEFRAAIIGLGIEAPRKEVDLLFDTIDADKSGSIDHRELTLALRKSQRQSIVDAKTKPAPPQQAPRYRAMPYNISLTLSAATGQTGLRMRRSGTGQAQLRVNAEGAVVG